MAVINVLDASCWSTVFDYGLALRSIVFSAIEWNCYKPLPVILEMMRSMAQPEMYSNNYPPLLQGAENYNDWKFHMKIFLQRDAFEWDAIENGFIIPMKDGKPKSIKDLSPEEVNAMNSNAKAMNSLINGMVATELRKVSACTTAKQIWDMIKVSHEGTSKDSNILSTMDTLTLFSELEELDNQLRRYDEEDDAPWKKTLALNVDADESPDDSDEEIALLTKKFHKFLAKRNASKRPMKSQFAKKDFKSIPSKDNKASSSKDTCFECGKKGHFKKDCYKLKNKKKALLTWSDDDSDVEIDSYDEVAQLCFVGLEDSSSDHDEDETLVGKNRSLAEKISKLTEENQYLKNEIEMKDVCLEALKKETSSVIPEDVKRDSAPDPLVPELKQKVTQLEKDLAKCFQGEGTLNALLAKQKSSLDKGGLGCESIKKRAFQGGLKRAPIKYKMPYEKCRDCGKSGHTTSKSRLCGIKGHSSNSSYRSYVK
ncbi:uncharacterized protein LOC141673720 [Apium graveolens]|uniref:uncharacterized protein LOC141673720 n=1 Tax=Apium graveolens TaxID=4045 RepID=UPI003D78DE9F